MTKKIFALVVTLMFSFISHAQNNAPKGITYKIEPLFGFETVYRNTPTPHTATHSMYGVRLKAGIPKISGEAEYTKGSDTENYTTAPETLKYSDEKLKLGINSIFGLSELFTGAVRLGGQAKKTSVESISAGVSTTTDEPIEYSPYAGAAFGIHLGKFMTIHLGSTVVFKDMNDMKKNEYQNTISFGVGI